MTYPKGRLRAYFVENLLIRTAVEAAKKNYPEKSFVFRRLEAVRFATYPKLSFATIGRKRTVKLSRASVYRFLRIARDVGIEVLCSMPGGAYRDQTTKVKPAIGEALRVEIKSKRIRSSGAVIRWLRTNHTIRMKATGVYAWLKRNGLRLKRCQLPR